MPDLSVETQLPCTPNYRSMHPFDSLTSDERAKTKKTLKKMMFLYLALLNGWHVHMLHDGKFQLYRGSPRF